MTHVEVLRMHSLFLRRAIVTLSSKCEFSNRAVLGRNAGILAVLFDAIRVSCVKVLNNETRRLRLGFHLLCIWIPNIQVGKYFLTIEETQSKQSQHFSARHDDWATGLRSDANPMRPSYVNVSSKTCWVSCFFTDMLWNRWPGRSPMVCDGDGFRERVSQSACNVKFAKNIRTIDLPKVSQGVKSLNPPQDSPK